MLSARRMNFIDGKPPQERIGSEVYMSPHLPQYSYFIPLDDRNMLNAHIKLSHIDNIHIFETEFESTSLLLATGSEIFFSRVNPDGTFDMLSDNFNYNLLGLAVIVSIVRMLSLKILINFLGDCAGFEEHFC